MASQPRSVTRARPSDGRSGLFEFGFDFTVPNDPNPDIFLPSLRMAGYTLETAVGDLVDNPLDKGASTILVEINKDDEDLWTVEVGDDGFGMNRDILDQMMRLGSRTDHELASDLGRFGLGSTTASLSLGRLQHVITMPDADTTWSAAADLDEAIRQQRFVKHLAIATEGELDLFREFFTRRGLAVPQTGTVVRVLRCDKVGRSSLKPAVDAMKKWIGETYRYFIDAGKQVFVNGEPVEALDPLERNTPETRILFDEAFEYIYPKNHPRAGEVEKVGVVLAHLPDYGGIEANRLHGYTIDKSGLYVMRNRRQVASAITFGFWTRHQELSRFRGELLFPATLDDDLGITFLKSAWAVHPTQSLRDKLLEIVMPYVRQARKLYRASVPAQTDDVTHDEAAKVIQQRAPFLRKPTSKTETRAPRDSEPSERVADDGKKPSRPREPRPERQRDHLADRAEFKVVAMGQTAPIFDANLIGRKVVIQYNSDHPFYQRFIMENRDNRSVVAGVDYFVYSLATAELLAQDEETYRFIETMRENMSFNLRQLLST